MNAVFAVFNDVTKKCGPCAIGAALFGALLGSPVGLVRAQQAGAGLEVLQVRANFYMIVGAGANIGVQIGADGAVVVNAGTDQASADVVAAIKKLTDQPIRYIIDTSADPDVIGGNAKVAKAGLNIYTMAIRRNAVRQETALTGADIDAARIVSHEAVLTRMSTPVGGKAPYASDQWPLETFNERRTYMYFNDEGIEMLHQPAAHTDGDVVVFFRKSDVVVAGNILDADRFPVIDLARGGSIDGEIDALNKLIELAIPPVPYVGVPNNTGNAIGGTGPQPGGTEVIPGRGRVYRQIDVVNYRDAVVIVRDNVQDMIDRKMTLDQIKAARPAIAYEPQWGAKSGPWTTDMFIEAIYKSLTTKRK